MLDYEPKGKKTVANFIHYIFLFNHWKKKIDDRQVNCFSFTIFWKNKLRESSQTSALQYYHTVTLYTHDYFTDT